MSNASSQYLRTPVIRYSSRMRVGKLHAMSVSLTGGGDAPRQPGAAGGFEPPIVVQVSAPGALVTPPHVILPLNGGEANFYVQPLAAGTLKGGKVEFLSQGRRIGEVPLKMKVNRGRLATWLLAFALALPFIIHLFPNLSYVDNIPSYDFPKNPKIAPDGNKPADAPPTKNTPQKPIAGLEMPWQESLARSDVMMVGAASEFQDDKKADEKKDQPKSETKAESKTATKAQDRGNGKQDDPPAKTPEKSRAPTKSPPPMKKGDPIKEITHRVATTSGIKYEKEDAIWAWIRGKLYQNGIRTTVGSTEKEVPADAIAQLLFVERKYTKLEEQPETDWTSGKIVSLGLYYVEPVLRFLYRFFIEFPRSNMFPMGDIIYTVLFLTLAALVWMCTNPNRVKIKGAVMDIRVS